MSCEYFERHRVLIKSINITLFEEISRKNIDRLSSLSSLWETVPINARRIHHKNITSIRLRDARAKTVRILLRYTKPLRDVHCIICLS